MIMRSTQQYNIYQVKVQHQYIYIFLRYTEH